MHERVLSIPDATERGDLATFLTRVVRLDESAVVRFRQRGAGRLTVWAATGFDALAVRTVAGTITPDDTSAAGDQLLAALDAATTADIDPGFSMDSAWRGALPPTEGFVHVDDVPARVLVDLAQRGAALAQEHGSSHGPPASLLDQEVLQVHGAEQSVGIPMRVVFALTAMGFVPQAGSDRLTADLDPERIDASELVRVRATGSWLRVDARFGSIYRHRGGGIPLSVARSGSSAGP
ncbi:MULTISPECIES: hypothetical protein [unclassified Rhodococcus (in: high G+C Gram-positive bacteria)]|uniref:hypothetical protein n=1 Tax=unclassified Rhodococcus (in: high G+C Gram-positive bacteria) TaxID=192944 RepID=UPI00163A5C7E|nr:MULTISPECIES: hypothetical protein [unclassified Rhodococcus (in: high G+C Gram-positive bacteria)]MBC2638835.1 hypothetical protein [Rhodococcus sp. 3A]MBC2896424.1 hypothetical protein [Rhodococcus sp. 4CII]